MTPLQLLTRRMAIAEMGKFGLAVAIFGVTACSPAPETTPPTTGGTVPGTSSTTTTSATSTTTGSVSGTEFHRVDLGFVSAYLLARDGQVVLVDTGVGGSANEIGAALGEIGLSWDALSHVILTHKHPDHIGSLGQVHVFAPDAVVHAGTHDVPAIAEVLAPQPVVDGDMIFGLRVIETPGHTAGHISVLDPNSGILVTGDALNGTNGGVSGADPAFSEDMAVANESVRKLATFDYQVALFGHGEPVLEDASVAVAELASTIG